MPFVVRKRDIDSSSPTGHAIPPPPVTTVAPTEADPAVRRRPFRGWIMVAAAMVANFLGRTHGLGTVTEWPLNDPTLSLGFVGASDGAVAVGSEAWVSARRLAYGKINLGATLVGKWFRWRLGAAMGVYSVLMSIGFLAAFAAARNAANLDWRTMWYGIGWGLLALAPLAWAFARSTPEACGLNPDGGPANASADAAGPAFTLAAALRTPAFWVFALSTSVLGLISSGIALLNRRSSPTSGSTNQSIT